MQFTPAGASAAHQKLGAGPPDRLVEAASAGGAPERVRAAQFPITRSSGQRLAWGGCEGRSIPRADPRRALSGDA